MSTYTVYSSDYDPNCHLCQGGVHQSSHATQIRSQQVQNNQFSQGYPQGQVIQGPIYPQQSMMQFNHSQSQLSQIPPQVLTNGSYSRTQLNGSPNRIGLPVNIVPPRIVQSPVPQTIVTPPRQQQVYQQQHQGYQQIVQGQQVVASPIQMNQQQQLIQQHQVIQQSPVVQQQPIYSQQSQLVGEQRHSESYVTQVHNVDHMPLVHEIHHIERPVQVIGIEEVEQPWRAKVTILERQLIELELMVKKQSRGETQQVTVEDTGKIKRLQKTFDELEALVRYQNFVIVREKDGHIDSQHQEIDRLLLELENSSGSSSGLSDELEKWKKNFIDMNRKFHNAQEDVMLKQAEIESLKNKKTITQTTTTTQQKSSSQQQQSSSQQH